MQNGAIIAQSYDEESPNLGNIDKQSQCMFAIFTNNAEFYLGKNIWDNYWDLTSFHPLELCIVCMNLETISKQ